MTRKANRGGVRKAEARRWLARARSTGCVFADCSLQGRERRWYQYRNWFHDPLERFKLAILYGIQVCIRLESKCAVNNCAGHIRFAAQLRCSSARRDIVFTYEIEMT
jgi:hypothetical protein